MSWLESCKQRTGYDNEDEIPGYAKRQTFVNSWLYARDVYKSAGQSREIKDLYAKDEDMQSITCLHPRLSKCFRHNSSEIILICDLLSNENMREFVIRDYQGYR